MVPYVDAVTMMRVLLFVLHVCMLRECEDDDNAGVVDGGGVVIVSTEHVGGARGSGIVFSAANVLGMSVMRGVRRVGGVCEMCLCLARGGVGGEGGEWMRGLGLDFTNPVGTVGVLDVCLCLACGFGVGVGGVGFVGREGAWNMVWMSVWCYVCVSFESGLFV